MSGLYVTDTHPLVWFAGGERRKLGRKARAAFDACEAGDVEIRVPVPVVIETWFLARNGTIKPRTSFAAWWRGVAGPGLVFEPLLAEDVLSASDLDWDQRDPFDRLIVATAQRIDAPLITADGVITDLGTIDVLW